MARFEMNETSPSGLGERVFEILRNDILEGKYKPGESLVETKLSEKLGVSRTPIRDAIRQLGSEGLVKIVPNRGAVVKGISSQDIKDIYKIRMLIEGMAAKRAAENITAEELDELRETVELEGFYTERKDVEHLTKLDTKFHDILFRASNSQPLTHMLSTFHHYLQKARSASMSVPGRALKVYGEHKAIFDAIEEGDADKAEMLTTKHITNASINIDRGTNI